jgi:hypothetical protein
MTGDRPRYGLLVSAFGAVVLAVAVFLPWYGVSFTAAGIAFAQQAGDQAAAQFGNAALQSYMGEYHATLSTLAGHQITALSAHEALKDLNVVLLLLAGAAIVIALLALAGVGSPRRPLPTGTAVRSRCSASSRCCACSSGSSIRRRPLASSSRCRCARARGWRCSDPPRSLWERSCRSVCPRADRPMPGCGAPGLSSPAGRPRADLT